MQHASTSRSTVPTILKSRYVRYVASTVAQAELGLRGYEQEKWLRALRTRQDAMRGALAVTVEEPSPDEAAMIVTSLAQYWCMSGSISEGHRWANRVLTQASALQPSLRLRLQNAWGRLAEYQSDFDVAEELHGLVPEGTEGDVYNGEPIDGLSGLAVIALWRGNADVSLSLSEEAIGLATTQEDRWRLVF